jgi:L-rhamnose isomerase
MKELVSFIHKVVENPEESCLISAILDDQLTRLNDLTEEPEKAERQAIMFELIEIKKLVGTHEEGLKKLRAQNRKTFMFVALFVFACFLIYCTYILIVGYD